MFSINGTSHTNNIQNFEQALLNNENTEFFNSIFSSTFGENEIIEATDFVNYKTGNNSFIDTLIKNGQKWSYDTVNKVIDSVKIYQKVEKVKISNENATASIDTNFTPEMKDVFELLMQYSFDSKGFELSNQIKEKYNSLKEEAKSIISEMNNVQTEEAKDEIKKTKLKPIAEELVRLNNISKVLKNKCEYNFDDLKNLGILDSFSIKEEEYNKTLSSFKLHSLDKKAVDCSLILKDENGNPRTINLKISLELINDYKKKHQNTDITYSQALENILQGFSSLVNKLPNEAKNDLYNEISNVNLDAYDSKGDARGLYSNNYHNGCNDITLFLGSLVHRYGTNYLEDFSDSLKAFTHEIGHSVETTSTKSTSSEFEAKFEEFRDLLLKKNLLPENYMGEPQKSVYYPMISPDEFFAEVVYSDRKSADTVFSGMNDILSSTDPEIQAKLQKLYALGDSIISDRRSSNRLNNVGLITGDLLQEIKTNSEVSNAYDKITLSLEHNLYANYGNSIQNMFNAYYEYKKNPMSNSEGCNLIRSFEENYPNDWVIISKIFDNHLIELGLF